MFRENGHNESHALFKDVNNILPALCKFFVQFLQKFRRGEHQFRENLHNESHTFLKDVNNILPALSTFFVHSL